MNEETRMTVEQAKAIIERNGGKVTETKVEDKTIKIVTLNSPGIKLLGALDFLVGQGYVWTRDAKN